MAANLKDLGIGQGDVVFLLSPNNPDYAIIYLATISIGAIITTNNPAYTSGMILCNLLVLFFMLIDKHTTQSGLCLCLASHAELTLSNWNEFYQTKQNIIAHASAYWLLQHRYHYLIRVQFMIWIYWHFIDEIAHALKLSECKLIITASEFIPSVKAALESLKGNHSVKVGLI